VNCEPHDNSDEMKVWLSEDDVDDLLDAAKDTERRIAFALGCKCGLRSAEILDVTPDDLVDSDVGHMLIIKDGKGGKYRETPIPSELVTQIETIDDYRDEDSDSPILSVENTNSLRYWIKTTREELAEETGDDRWNYVSMHDLRRTWATSLASKDVDPLIVCDWGGWSDLDTFLDHYRGTYNPEAQQRERDKVEWL